MELFIKTTVAVISLIAAGGLPNLAEARSPEEMPLKPAPVMFQKMYQYYGGSDYKIFGTEISRYRAVFDSLPESIKQALLRNDTTDNQISDFDLRQLDTNTIAMLQKDLLRILKDTQVMSVVRNFQSMQRYREAAKVLERLGYRLTSQQIIQLLSSIDYGRRCSKDVQTMVRQGLRYIDSPDQWNSQTLDLLGGTVTATLPADILMRIEDRSLALSLLQRLLAAQDGSFGCGMTGVSSSAGADFSDQIVHIHRVQLKLLLSAYGKQSEWTEDILRSNQQLLSSLTIQSLQTIKSSVLDAVLPVLSQITTWDTAQSYCIVRRISENKGNFFNTITPDQFGAFLDSLGRLGPYFLPQYLPISQNSSRLSPLISVWADRMDSYILRGMALPKRTYRALLQYHLSGKNMDSLTSQDLNKLGPGFLKVAPRKLWTHTLRLNYVDRAVIQRLAIDESAGYLKDGDISRLSPSATQLFRSNGRLDFYNIPSVFLSGATFTDVTSSYPSEIQSALKRIDAAADWLTPGQISAVLNKLHEGGYDLSSLDMGPVLKSYLNVGNLTRMPSGQLKRLAANMPADSLIRLYYGGSRFGNMNVTVEDLQNDPLLIATLNWTQINGINLNDTPALLSAVRTAAQGPSVQTVRALQSRLRNYTRARRLDIDDNDRSVIENAWLTNFDIYPATVLAGFSNEALELVSPAKKIEILRAMGNLPMADYYTIPRAKRFAILKQGLYALNKDNGELNDADLVLLGNAVLDLSRRDIQRLSFRALEYALPFLQGDVDILSGLSARPCLNADQRAGIRQSIKAAYGDPGSWDVDTMAVVCCSIDTLSVDELNVIRDDVIIECECTVDYEPSLHLRHLSQAVKLACITELGPELGLLNSGLESVKSRKATAALNIFQDNRIIIPGMNNINSTRAKRETKKLNCDAIINSGFGAAAFSPQLLDTLPLEQVEQCLYEMGMRYLSTEQAQVIWKKLKASFGGVPNIPDSQLKQLGYVLRGMDTDSIKQLTLSSPDVIAAIGLKDRALTKEQLKALTSEALLDWKKPSEYTGQNLNTLGYLTCGLPVSSIQQIPPESYRFASPIIGILENCDSEVLTALAQIAKRQDVFQAPSSWNATVVRNIGSVIGGLSAEELRSVPAGSMAGLTPVAVRSITANNFKALLTEQIRNFPLAAAEAVTTDQRKVIIAEMSAALDYVIWGADGRGAANYMYSSTCLIFIMLLITKLY